MTDPKLARVAKGKRPQYFSDPATDKLFAIVMSLVAELSVTRDRLDTLERVLARNGSVSLDDVEAYTPDPQVAAKREAKRTAYIERVFRVMQMELEEVDSGGSTKSFEEVYKTLL
ncbi:MAG: hypothetical protein AAF438_12670 [Pseudomonadota bacterium]